MCFVSTQGHGDEPIEKRWGPRDASPGLWGCGCWYLWRSECHLGNPRSAEPARFLCCSSGRSMEHALLSVSHSHKHGAKRAGH